MPASIKRNTGKKHGYPLFSPLDGPGEAKAAMNILIYQDYFHNHGLLYRSLCRHFGADNVEFCDAQDILGGILTDRVSLLVMPGGADLLYMERLQDKGAEAIRNWVQRGGHYFG